MPQIPRKEELGSPSSFRSGRQLVTAGAVDTGAVGAGAKSLARGISDLGSGVAAYGEERRKEREAVELAKADSALKKGLTELETKIEGEPDYDTRLPKFEQGASSVLDNASSVISNEDTREKWQARAGAEIATRQGRVARNTRKLQREEDAVDLEGSLKRYRSVYASPKADKEDRKEALNDIENTIQVGRRSGILTPSQEESLREEYIRGTLQEEAEQRLLTDPGGLLEDLQPREQTGEDVEAGEDRDGVFVTPDLQIVDRTSETAPYGRQATRNAKPFKGAVIHHTESGTSAEDVIGYGHTTDQERGGSFGYHFYVDADGTIYQGAPLDARTNHVKPSNSRQRRDRGKQLRNTNAIGISLVGGEDGATSEQKAAATRLTKSLSKTYGFSEDSVYGHGEIQKDRQRDEGQEVVSVVRGREELGAAPTGPYAALPADRRRILMDRAKDRLRKADDDREIELTELKDSDIESIRRTGQPVADEADLREIRRTLSQSEYRDYQRERRKWMEVHEETESIRRMSDAELDERLEELKPEAGADDFEYQAEVYDEVEGRAEEIREARENNPAMAVAHFEQVNEAVENLDISDRRSTERIVTARLAAQEKIGIPEHRRQPITREEARILMEPVDGLEGEKLLQGMEKLSRDVQRIYGRYSRHVMTSAVELMVERKSTARRLTGIINEFVSRGTTSEQSLRETRRELEEAAIERAVEVGENVRRGEPPAVNREAMGPRAPAQQERVDETTLKQTADQRVPLSAKQYLRNNPHEAQAFDQHYQTPGLAEYILKQDRNE